MTRLSPVLFVCLVGIAPAFAQDPPPQPTHVAADTFRAGSVASKAIARFLATEDVREHAHYAFLDDGTVSNPKGKLFGHASFNASATIGGATEIDHHHAYQDASVWSGTGTLKRMAALQVQQVVRSGYVPELAGLYYQEPTHTGGRIGVLAAVRVFLNAGEKTYSFYSSGTAKMQQNGAVIVGSPTGGDKGPGTINVSGDIYTNGTSLLDRLDALTKRVAELEAALARKR